jgi:hypothetical protein
VVNREGDGINFLQRAALYGLLGLMSGRRGDDLARLAIGMPILEKLTGVTLEEALAAEAQRQQEIERQQRLEQIRAAILTTLKSTSAEPVASSLNTDLLVPDGITATIEPDARWRQVVIHPSVILVLGKRGSGKSALGYRILELLRYTLTPSMWWASPEPPGVVCNIFGVTVKV